MVDDWQRIRLSECDPRSLEVGRSGSARLVDTGRTKASELGDPRANVATVGIEFDRLAGGVEHSEIGSGVGAGPGDPLPVSGILGDIGVDQVVSEETFAFSPVDEEVFDQEAGTDHANPVVHPPGLGQLAHSRVDDGIAGTAGAAAFEAVGIIAPRNVVVAGLERGLGKVGV
jgi:hypothetical protein